MATHKTGDVARRLNIHANTVRSYADRYGGQLSPGATATRRRFTDSDVRILATVAHHRDQGIDLSVIDGLIEAGQLVEDLPPEITPQVEEVRQSVEVVEIQRLNRALDRIQVLETEIDRLADERDKAQIGADEANRRILELEREKASLTTRLELVEADRKPTLFWVRWLAIAVIAAVLLTAALAVLLALVAR